MSMNDKNNTSKSYDSDIDDNLYHSKVNESTENAKAYEIESDNDIESVRNDFVKDERYEFEAPQYCDFTKLNEENDNNDDWFDKKTRLKGYSPTVLRQNPYAYYKEEEKEDVNASCNTQQFTANLSNYQETSHIMDNKHDETNIDYEAYDSGDEETTIFKFKAAVSKKQVNESIDYEAYDSGDEETAVFKASLAKKVAEASAFKHKNVSKLVQQKEEQFEDNDAYNNSHISTLLSTSTQQLLQKEKQLENLNNSLVEFNEDNYVIEDETDTNPDDSYSNESFDIDKALEEQQLI